MKAVIAEKPSVGREIAALLGASERHEGYFEGNGYLVTWALGHLVGLGMPEDYGLLGFKREVLPILPDPFKLTVRKIKKNKGYDVDPGAERQLKIIEKVFSRSDSIIVATDAGREGELIFRYIYQFLKCKKPFERLWISSLTEKAIRKGFENLKPGSDFDRLYEAAETRSRADWLVGINSSQALSVAVGNGIYSLGRVQTPVLALICKRYQDHKNFKIEPYWQIRLEHRQDFMDFKSLSVIKWENRRQAEDVHRAVIHEGKAIISSIEKKPITEQPPLLFDLTGLQKEANRKLSLSAEETLDTAQRLYEKKLITYPRTGSRYIPEDLWSEIPDLVRSINDRESLKEAASKMKWGSFNKRIVNDMKVTDHHGLLITGKFPSVLTAKENAIYDMIACRLLEALSQACQKELTDITAEVLHYDFVLKGSKVIEPGWRAIRGYYSEEDNELTQELPQLQKGQEIKIKSAEVLQKKTSPPVLYTEAGLLSAMETAGKKIENEEKRRILQNIGIGTPATRASIIETLFSRNYIVREKKSLIPTEKGQKVYELIKDMKIAEVEMTANWELALHEIENSDKSSINFHKEMEEFASLITSELLALPRQNVEHKDLTCPKCKAHQLIIEDRFVKCPCEECAWIQFRNICGINLGFSDLETLIVGGKTSLLRGMKSKSGKIFDAYIVLNEKAESSFEFENGKSKKR
ncbi:type IA DNA topoisomerase [Chryseobacterium populi]|nr:type IA DNA topoisomerase [Chryseobacterium populi]